MTEVKIKNVPRDMWSYAIARANHFEIYYPERMGVRDGVGYTTDLGIHFYVYRTKTQVIVVGND